MGRDALISRLKEIMKDASTSDYRYDEATRLYDGIQKLIEELANSS